METLKITITIEPAREWFSDWVIVQLGEIGFEGFEETDTGIEAYISEDSFNRALLEQTLSALPKDYKIRWTQEKLEDRNWNEVWEKNYFRPLMIGGECVVRAPFHTDYPSCRYEIIIEPNMAFGTGNHETTTMMVEFLLKENLKGKAVLDMGCGTGILSIFASMAGAESVVAIDIGEWPFRATAENARLNYIANIKARLGGASLLGDETFDFILANIERNVLLNDMGKYVSVLNPGGTLILSGFYAHDIPPIKEKAESLGLTDSGYAERNKWVASKFEK